jgi:hypothetical protein
LPRYLLMTCCRCSFVIRIPPQHRIQYIVFGPRMLKRCLMAFPVFQFHFITFQLPFSHPRLVLCYTPRKPCRRLSSSSSNRFITRKLLLSKRGISRSCLVFIGWRLISSDIFSSQPLRDQLFVTEGLTLCHGSDRRYAVLRSSQDERGVHSVLAAGLEKPVRSRQRAVSRRRLGAHVGPRAFNAGRSLGP